MRQHREDYRPPALPAQAQRDSLPPGRLAAWHCGTAENFNPLDGAVTLTADAPQEQVNALLEALAQGPESDALAALLPEEFTVLSARVEEGTCYLNLPSDADLGISPRQTVESLVLSLCSLDTVERVQIVVDGEIAAQLNGVNVGEPLTP